MERSGLRLGEPGFTRPSAPGFVSLGCDGELVLRFVDNLLIDVDGPGRCVFEVGPMVEAVDLGILVDGGQWLDVGRIDGAQPPGRHSATPRRLSPTPEKVAERLQHAGPWGSAEPYASA